MGEHRPDTARVVGSNPIVPTTSKPVGRESGGLLRFGWSARRIDANPERQRHVDGRQRLSSMRAPVDPHLERVASGLVGRGGSRRRHRWLVVAVEDVVDVQLDAAELVDGEVDRRVLVGRLNDARSVDGRPSPRRWRSVRSSRKATPTLAVRGVSPKCRNVGVEPSTTATFASVVAGHHVSRPIQPSERSRSPTQEVPSRSAHGVVIHHWRRGAASGSSCHTDQLPPSARQPSDHDATTEPSGWSSKSSGWGCSAHGWVGAQPHPHPARVPSGHEAQPEVAVCGEALVR